MMLLFTISIQLNVHFLSWQKLPAAIFFKTNHSTYTYSRSFGAKLLSKLAASDLTYNRISAEA